MFEGHVTTNCMSCVYDIPNTGGQLETFKMGELFCGPGGLARGAERSNQLAAGIGLEARINHAWANDYDRDTCNTYKRNVLCASYDTVFCADVRGLDLNQVP